MRAFSFLLAFLIQNLSLAASFCSSADQVNPAVCTPLTQQQEYSKSQCEISLKIAKCDEWVNKNPGALSKLRDCNALAVCPTYLKVADYAVACKEGLKGSVTDIVVGVIDFVATDFKMSPDLAARSKYLNNCSSASCKREMLGPYISLFSKEEIEGQPYDKKLYPKDPLYRNLLDGKSAATLYRELLVKLKSRLANKDLDIPFVEPWSGKNAKSSRSMNDMIDKVLESAGVKNTACYDPAVLAEMRCYAFATIVDPLMAAKGIESISRIAGVAGKAAKSSKIVKEVEFALKPASNESKIKSTSAILEELETKKKSLLSTKKMAESEKEIPAAKDLGEINVVLNSNQEKVSELEKLGDGISRAQKSELSYLKTEKSMLDAKLDYQKAINKYHADKDNMIAELEKFPAMASVEDGALMNTKIHEINAQLASATDLEIKMIKEENKLLKVKARETEIVNLNLNADQRISEAQRILLRGQEDKAIFDMTIASRNEYQAKATGKDAKVFTEAKIEAQKRLTKVRTQESQNKAQAEKLNEQAVALVNNDVKALETLKSVVQNSKNAPKGVTYDGYIYRSGAPEIHPGNLAANHRYSEPGQGLLYTSESAKTVAAELNHYSVDASTAAPIKPYKVKVQNVLDLTDAKTRQVLGLDLASMMRNDYVLTHSLGDVARELGYKGIIAPSARDPSGRHVLLFEEVKVPKD
jgi:RES domain-containing protein/predicted hotdog family 3-hydroxylacyl-ACP dehydratase